MVIWKYDIPAAARSVGWAVVVNNVEALRILLNIDYFRAAALAACGALVRAVASQAILGAAGLVTWDTSILGFRGYREGGEWIAWAGRLVLGR
jgi:hypothetical protein